jgi:hypothetical protein
MKKILLILGFLLWGCSGSDEQAPENLKYGDDFFAKKEYEIAEYYYEKIPEESPLYSQARKKLEEISIIKKQWVEKSPPAAVLQKIVILNNVYGIDNVTGLPTHTLTILNNTDRIVEYLTFEFSYFDEAGKLVAQYTLKARTPLFQGYQDIFGGLQPGRVDKKFTSSTVKIINARFQ